MTDDMMTLQTLLAEQPDAAVLREMIGFAAQRLMELEVESKTGAAHGERGPDRLTRRNGYRDRSRAPLSTGDPGRHGRSAHSAVTAGQLLPGVPGAAADE